MSEEKNIINYTAADIEKYWKGTLSAAEMHAMEKAAMDDPFLADALEGYKNINLADTGLDSLKEKLEKRVGAFVPVLNLKRKRFTWVRAAAAIIIIVGVGLLVQQLVFKNRSENSIAVLEKKEKQPESAASNNPIKPDSIQGNVKSQRSSDTLEPRKKISVTLDSHKSGSYVYTPIDTIKKIDKADAVVKKTDNEIVPAGNAQVIANAEKKGEVVNPQADLKRTSDDTTKALNEKKFIARSVAKPKANQEYFDIRDNAGISSGFALNNKYNYRVVDAQKNPVPFANVMNTRDNIGTYTDIRGNFNLVSSDSILHVQIRSLGYNAANYKLVPSNVQSGDLVLKEAERKETVSQNKKVVSSLSRKDSAEIEEPEVGWGNYNTYVANNIQIPDNVRPKNTSSDVELSFDIDKTGQPINIKVTRSSQCKECDEEAIRLLKEGPKWKRKGKKSKATVSISVDK
ncbi:MAG TPA: carboxypeptidase-like regulatory domain-containing protein [Chitinophagaceae bacterium]|nr:carboxypeptidase-like regulatory domain-containing protein [Chitinophagaceae bacterium]